MDFRWNDWNVEQVTRHGVTLGEAEAIVQSARPPYPRYQAEGKWLVWGRGRGDRLLQVVYVLDDDDTRYVIHARPLTRNETKRFRRGRRS